MTEPVSRILTELQSLSDDERAEIAFAALDSLGPIEEQQGEAWEAELQRRGAEIRSGQAEGRSADEVFARLKGRRS